MLGHVKPKKRKILCHINSFWLISLLCLLLGITAGGLFCRLGFRAILDGLFQLHPAAIADDYGYFAAFAQCVRFPFFLFLVSFSQFAAFLIPCTLAVRGFLLAYSIGSYTILYGVDGFLAGFQLSLYHGILMLPILLFLAVWGLSRSEPRLDKAAATVGILTLLVSLLLAVPEYFLTPRIVSYFAKDLLF
jgi:hypothetical protein